MRRNILLLLLAIATAAPALAAIRLPQTVIPSHYTIRIEPDLAAETFRGEETIDVDVREATDSIVMHSVELDLRDVTVSAGAKQLPATVTGDPANETVTLKTAETLPAGHAAIRIAFSGKLNQRLSGLYVSRTAKRKYAVTQFEAMSARRAFPCFDEPAMKATFGITLVVDKGDTAISNEAIASDTPAGEGKHAVRFGKTKRLPTYLVAMLVGDFECIKGESAGVPIRVCATPGLQNLGRFALDVTRASLPTFNSYYGIKYPFGKLDLIGIPDFAAGAMENAGAITFRETDLLVDDRNASELVRKRVAEVVAHEIAHQWFGDLVTMKWWNDIWLNEGFATFMSSKPIEEWKPEWRADLDDVAATFEALTVDSQLSTRPIRLPASTESASFEAGIVYTKTAAVLRMIENWIGKDAFRDAIRAYLKKYSWSNAEADDLWASLEGSSKMPIHTVLESFVDTTGAPLLHIDDACDANGRRLTLSQERLLPTGIDAPAGTAWTIPICAHPVGAKGSERCRVIDKQAAMLSSAAACDLPLFLSREGSGYFAVDYPPAERAALRARLAELTPAERISWHANEWLLVRTMRREVGEYLDLLRALPRPAERQIVTAMADNLAWLERRLVDEHNRAAWQAAVRDVLRGYPATWETPAGETSEQRIARAAVLLTLGLAGDADVVAGARRTAEQYMKDPASVDALIADRALRVSAIYGDDPFFDRVLAQLGAAQTPEVAARYRNLLALFRDPKLTTRAIDYIYSGKVRTQDMGIVAGAMFLDPATRRTAWAATQSRWEEIDKTMQAGSGRLALAVASFCDPESKKEVEAFFAAHPPRGGDRVVRRAVESISTCIAFREAQQKSFDKGLK